MKPATVLLFQIKGETQATAVNPTLADLTESPYSLLSRQGICDLAQILAAPKGATFSPRRRRKSVVRYANCDGNFVLVSC